MKFTIALVASSVVALSGCASAPEETQEPNDEATSDDGTVGSTSQALWIAPANTSPPSEAGFKMYKGLPYVWAVTNKQSRVAFLSGNFLATRTYSGATSERFAIYDMKNGTYSLCVPGTLVKKTVTLPYPYGTNVNYEANCLHRNASSHDLRFYPQVLAQTATGTTSPFYVAGGNIKTEASAHIGYNYWVLRGEYMTNNGSNVIVGGNKSGSDDQVWRAISL